MFGDVVRKINTEFEEEEEKEEPWIPKRKVRRKKKYYSKEEKKAEKIIEKSERSIRRAKRSVVWDNFTMHPIRFLYRIHFFYILWWILCVLTWTAIMGGAIYLFLMTVAYTGYEAAHWQWSLKIPGVAKLCHDVEWSTSGYYDGYLGSLTPALVWKYGGVSTPLFAVSSLAIWYAIKFGFIGFGMIFPIFIPVVDWLIKIMDETWIGEKGIPGALALIALGGFIIFAL